MKRAMKQWTLCTISVFRLIAISKRSFNRLGRLLYVLLAQVPTLTLTLAIVTLKSLAATILPPRSASYPTSSLSILNQISIIMANSRTGPSTTPHRSQRNVSKSPGKQAANFDGDI
jgi:hypothetical protein